MTDQSKPDDFRIGDRWIYMTPSGRPIEHEVVAVDVKPKHRHKPGNCVRLRAVHDRVMPDAIMWPADILAVDWMVKVASDDQERRP